MSQQYFTSDNWLIKLNDISHITINPCDLYGNSKKWVMVMFSSTKKLLTIYHDDEQKARSEFNHVLLSLCKLNN